MAVFADFCSSACSLCGRTVNRRNLIVLWIQLLQEAVLCLSPQILPFISSVFYLRKLLYLSESTAEDSCFVEQVSRNINTYSSTWNLLKTSWSRKYYFVGSKNILVFELRWASDVPEVLRLAHYNRAECLRRIWESFNIPNYFCESFFIKDKEWKYMIQLEFVF